MSAARPRTVRTRFAVAATAIVMLAACAPIATYPSASITVNPCETQSSIGCDFAFGHIATSPGGTPRQQLVVFLNGSGATPQGYLKVNSALAQAGFHVLNLRYPSTVPTAGACPEAVAVADPECFRAFKGELVTGENVTDANGVTVDSPAVSVNRVNSVTNRLLRLVNYLADNAAASGWGQYLQRTDGVCDHVDDIYGVCDLDWSKVVVMGHSLGAGVALYLAKLHPVARLAMISGPADLTHDESGAPVVAPWIAEGGFATPASRMFSLTHRSESAFADEQAAIAALGIDTTTHSVDGDTAPFGDAHDLTTGVTPACTGQVAAAHNSTAQDGCTPGTTPRLTAAWQYLAGA